MFTISRKTPNRISALMKDAWCSIPSQGKLFFKKAFLFFIGWKLVYHFVLFENRILDKPLTQLSAKATIWVLHYIGRIENLKIIEQVKEVINGESAYASVIYSSHTRLLGVLDACNGLELFVLYAGLIIAFSLPLKRMLLFLTGGLLLIFTVNIFRLVCLAALNAGHRSSQGIPYHFLFNILVYAVVGILWVWYVNDIPKKAVHAK